MRCIADRSNVNSWGEPAPAKHRSDANQRTLGAAALRHRRMGSCIGALRQMINPRLAIAAVRNSHQSQNSPGSISIPPCRKWNRHLEPIQTEETWDPFHTLRPPIVPFQPVHRPALRGRIVCFQLLQPRLNLGGAARGSTARSKFWASRFQY